jgi:transposase
MRKPEPLPDRSSPSRRRPKRETLPGKRAQADGLELRSYDVGALPLIKRIFERMQLERLLHEHLPKDDQRTELPTVTALLVLFANLLLAREPVYGVGEWAAIFPPDLLGLREQDLSRIHDDRLGRGLDRMFEGIGPTLIMAVVRQVIREFAVSLDELHNDSTTVSFYGAYNEAGQESEQRGFPTHAITWGHSKARRPDLKQLLYVLTVTSDGDVPIYFSSADCKLASSENLSHIAARGGRFVTVLPRGRNEDVAFRQRLRAAPSALTWTPLYVLGDKHGNIVDELSACEDDHVHSEGYRLLWYQSTRKAEQDEAGRARSIQRATEALGELRDRLQGSRTRFRERAKVEQAVAGTLADADASSWLMVQIEEQEEETFRQATRGRPSEQTKYLKQTRSRYTLTWKLNLEALSEAEREDGVFPLLTNDRKLSATEVLRAYKRQGCGKFSWRDRRGLGKIGRAPF